ncbi:hypothetical protein ZOSMA_127G00120 [Zostera marina]|uniref:TF-B3 domain-containing protein n=1 Tax=Zostera marina TaxID=29655 RepID=A0A0K9PZN8_ZOSMR|nr:hypothetical protein ZOSMA_127G00120 [Zostera marina]
MIDVGETNEFFKVLLDGFNEKLRIPDKFVSSFFREQGKVNLCSSILGKIWCVEIRQHSDGLYFSGDGWIEFVQDHDLHFGYFLVFVCHQNINFFVKSFDHSGCRKLYTPINDHVEQSNFSEERNNLSEARCAAFTRENNFKEGDVCNFKLVSRVDLSVKEENSNVPGRNITQRGRNKSETVTLKPKVMKKEKTNVEKFLKAMKKPQFKISTQPSYIDKKLMHFADRFHDTDINETTCSTTDERFSAKFRKEGDSSFSRRNFSRKTTGDQLKKSVANILNVIKKPQFKKSMARSYIYKNFMSFPSSFRDANNLFDINEVILTNNNGCWAVKFCHCFRKNGILYSFFSGGWSVFKLENNLKEGDVCIFELSSTYENRANFIVTKEMNLSRNYDHSNVSRQKKCRKVNISETTTLKLMATKKRIVEKSLKVKQKPNFKINMTHTSINNYLHFPQAFRDANNLSTINEVILTNTNGYWPVKFYQRISRKNGYVRSVFSSGWVIFTRENNLKIGDVCCFELSSTNESKAIFSVTKLSAFD